MCVRCCQGWWQKARRTKWSTLPHLRLLVAFCQVWRNQRGTRCIFPSAKTTLTRRTKTGECKSEVQDEMQLPTPRNFSRPGQLQKKVRVPRFTSRALKLGYTNKNSCFSQKERSFSSDFLLGIWVSDWEKKCGEDTDMEAESHAARRETQRKLFGWSSTTLSFVTLGQDL